MRIAIGQIAHKTNTFCQGETELASFEALDVLRANQIVAANRGIRTIRGGMIEAADRLDLELVPTISAVAERSGTISAAAYDALLGELLGGIAAAQPVDAVCLALHNPGARGRRRRHHPDPARRQVRSAPREPILDSGSLQGAGR